MGQISRRKLLGTIASTFAWPGVLAAWADRNRQASVALLLSGVITDGGWSQLAYDGLRALKTRYGFKTAYAENIGIAEMDQVTRGYSDDGFDLIVGHGLEFSSTFLEVAPDYPSQRFFVTTFRPQPSVPPNIMYINMGYVGAAFGAGVLAALISDKKRAVGFIGGADDPNQQNIKKSYIAGVRQTAPGMEALAIITGDYDNASKGREAASILIGNGADVLWHAADVTGLGVIQAAVAGNVKVMGCYSDQTDLAPNNVATSFVMDLGGMVTHVAQEVANGAFEGGTEWRRPVNQMWLQKCGKNGDYNLRLISVNEWNTFQKVWGDIGSRKIDADRFVA